MWEEIIRLIIEGSFLGIPTFLFMSSSFVLGFILGWLMKRVLKIALLFTILIGAGIYFGILSLSVEKLRLAIETYGPQIIHLATIIIGIIPLSAGLIVGLIFGLKFG